MEKPFDPTKPVETRNGQTVRIICTDAKSAMWPVVALVMDKETSLEQVHAFKANGQYHWHGSSSLDLINIPQKKSGWVNLWKVKEGQGQAGVSPGTIVYKDMRHALEARAAYSSGNDMVDTIEIHWEE